MSCHWQWGQYLSTVNHVYTCNFFSSGFLDSTCSYLGYFTPVKSLIWICFYALSLMTSISITRDNYTGLIRCYLTIWNLAVLVKTNASVWFFGMKPVPIFCRCCCTYSCWTYGYQTNSTSLLIWLTSQSHGEAVEWPAWLLILWQPGYYSRWWPPASVLAKGWLCSCPEPQFYFE